MDRRLFLGKIISAGMLTAAAPALASSEIVDATEISRTTDTGRVFSNHTIKSASYSIVPPNADGFFDANGRFHGVDWLWNCHPSNTPLRGGDEQPCLASDCIMGHAAADKPLKIFEYPISGEAYCCGAHVEEGLGDRFSVAVVIRKSKGTARPRVVAVWRSNVADPVEFSRQLNFIGRYYNTALIASECNKHSVTTETLDRLHQYPNIYLWKSTYSRSKTTPILGWFTSLHSRPLLHQAMQRHIDNLKFAVVSANLWKEMAEISINPDLDNPTRDEECKAAMIALYCANEVEVG